MGRLGPKRASARKITVWFTSLLLLMILMPAHAQSPSPSPDPDAIPPRPERVGARTGSLTVSPAIVKEGEQVTAVFSPMSGSVTWSISSPAGSNCAGKPKKVTGEELKHSVTGVTGGPTSCTWKATAGGNSWQRVSAGITGPCGDPEMVRQGKHEFAACAGAGASDSYYVIAKKQYVLYGTIAGTEGDPIAGVVLEIEGDEDTQFVVTDGRGLYKKKVKEGTYNVRPTVFEDRTYGGVKTDDFSPAGKTVNVKGPTQQDFEVKGYRLSGHVLNDKKEGIPNLKIVIWSNLGRRDATTDHEGAYFISVPKGDYAIEVRSPPPNQSGRDATNWGIPYLCTMSGSKPDDRVCKVDVSGDRTNVSFKIDLSVDVEIEVGKTPDKSGRYKAEVRVTDSQDKPVGDQPIKFEPSRKIDPRMMICTADGFRHWPQTPPNAGDTQYEQKDFTLRSDDQGKIAFYIWPGIQTGNIELKASVPDSKRKDEEDEVKLEFTGGGTSLPGDKTLETTIIKALKSKSLSGGGPDFNSPEVYATGNPATALDLVLRALVAKRSALNISLSPIHTVDKMATGILILPGSPDGTTLKEVGSVLESGGVGASLGAKHYILDATGIAEQAGNAASWAEMQIDLFSLSEWTQQTQSPARAGKPNASGAEVRFTYFGWVYPPVPHTKVDQCAGIAPGGQTAEVHSPVRLMFTNEAGQRFGDAEDDSDDPIVEVDGSWIDYNEKGEPERYLMPSGKYKVDVTGTADGSATVVLIQGGTDDLAQVFEFDVTDRTRGAIDLFDDGNGSPPLDLGRETVTATAGISMKVAGIPKKIPSGAIRNYTITVKDQFGKPVEGATVSGRNDHVGFVAGSLTRADGKAEMTLVGPADGQTVLLEARAIRHATFQAKILPDAQEPITQDPEVRGFVGSPPKIESGLLRELALIPILLIGLYVVAKVRKRRKA